MKFNKLYSSKIEKFDVINNIDIIDKIIFSFLSEKFNLIKVDPPLIDEEGSELFLNLNHKYRKINFDFSSEFRSGIIMDNLSIWRYKALLDYGIEPGKGIFTFENTIERDSEMDASNDIQKKYFSFDLNIYGYDKEIILKKVTHDVYDIINKAIYEISGNIYPKTALEISSNDLEIEYPDIASKNKEWFINKEVGPFILKNPGKETFSGRIHSEQLAEIYQLDYDNEIIFPAPNELPESLHVAKVAIKAAGQVLKDQLELFGISDLLNRPFFSEIASLDDAISLEVKINMHLVYLIAMQLGHIAEIVPNVKSREAERLNAFKKIKGL
ncbi:MAG: hypothetical protein NC236_01285 [Mycoplasma sp.]|nr:hypothetical protein [Mycoplasma sp.]